MKLTEIIKAVSIFAALAILASLAMNQFGCTRTIESDGGASGVAMPEIRADSLGKEPGNLLPPGPSLSFPWEKFDLIAFASAGIYAQQKSLTDEWLNIQYPSNAGVMTTLVYGRFFPGRDWGHHTKFYFFGLTDWTIYAVAREDSATSARMAWTDYKTIPWGL